MGRKTHNESRRKKQVALAIRPGVSHLEDVCHGILSYVRGNAHWQLTMAVDYWPPFSVTSLTGWKGDGVIAWILSQAEVRAAHELGLPVVNCSGALPNLGILRVTVDNRAIGRLAAEHLLECGFRRFAFFGRRGTWNAYQRREGFVETIKNAGAEYSTFHDRKTRTSKHSCIAAQNELRQWLASLKRPFGLFAYNDYRAARAMDACRQLGMHLPGDVAVVGVNDDHIVCEFCNPSLTSVACNGEAVGRLAAVILDRMMAGEKLPAEDLLVQPKGVVKRSSTEFMAVEDPHVAAAVRFIQEHIETPLGVDAMARELDISRRALEKAFRTCLGQTPHAYINYLRVQLAKKLLVSEKKIIMEEVARRCGFSDARRMRLVFHRITGISPRQYRNTSLAAR